MYRHLDAPIPDVDTYLQRLETERGEDLDKDYLDTLIYAHQCKIIFENLDVYGSYKPHEPISLGIEDIFQKIIRQERGGYCFELNALFTQLLKDLGYAAYPCMCRIVRGKDHTPPILHRGIIVKLEQGLYFCDVGYGGPMPSGAVLIQDGHSEDLHGSTFYIRKKDDYWWILGRITSSGTYEDVLEFNTMPQENVDFITMNEYCSKSEESVFTQKYFLNVRTPAGSKSILGDVFTCVEHGQTKQESITSQEQFEQILEEHFHLTKR